MTVRKCRNAFGDVTTKNFTLSTADVALDDHDSFVDDPRQGLCAAASLKTHSGKSVRHVLVKSDENSLCIEEKLFRSAEILDDFTKKDFR